MNNKKRTWLYFILSGIFLIIYLQSEAARDTPFIFELSLLLAGACLAFAVNSMVKGPDA